MQNKLLQNLTFSFIFVFSLLITRCVYAQQTDMLNNKANFWKKVRFGGGLGLSFGDFTNITIAPSAIYNFNEYFSGGIGLLGSYVSAKDRYKATIIGGSLISLFNPVKEIQLSLELEQLHVNATIQNTFATFGQNAMYDPSQIETSYEIKNNFYTTALFVGGGYNFGGVTVGGKYNLLFDKNKSAYSTAFMPFVRVYF